MAAARVIAVAEWEGIVCTASSLEVGSKVDEPVQAWRGGDIACRSRAKSEWPCTAGQCGQVRWFVALGAAE